MHIKKHANRILSLLLVVVTLFSLAATPAMAAVVPSQNKSLGDGSSTVTIKQGSYIRILGKSTGGTVGGSGWTYTSNDGITGPAYCVNWGLSAVSPSKKLEITGRYDRSPKTMGAFANGYPQRTLEQFKSLHPGIQGIGNLTENEYAYATQLAIWATCGQLAVPGTAFSSGRASLVKPTSDAQKIRVYESVVEILRLANGWSKQVYSGLYFHMEKDRLGASLNIQHEDGLKGAAEAGQDGIKKETINGKEYYTRLMYVDSATSTYPNDYEIYVYAMDAPAGTIMTDANNQVYPSRQQWGATMYEVPTPKDEPTSLNANGSAYTGAFKLCIPADNVTDFGTVTVQAYAVITQFNLYLAHNPAASEQSYIIADPAYVGRFAKADIKWNSAERPDTASLQVQKVDGSAMPLEGAEFTLTGSKGTTRTGVSDQNGYVEWTDLPADETFVLTETKAPAGFSIAAPRNITLTAGQTAHVTIQDSTEKHFIIKKIDKQNGSALEGAVFLFEKIDGAYKTTATTGFDGMLEFAGDELPYGSYRVSEERAPTGYEKDTSIQTVEWDGTRDVLLTFQDVRKPTIIGSKVDGITGVSLPGASFDVYKDGKKIGSVTTDDSGEFRFPIEGGEGYYEFVETVAPEGYVLDRTPHGLHVDPYDPQTKDDPVLTIENYSRPALRIIKMDQKSGDRLPGVTFEIYRNAELFDTAATDSQGEIVYFDLEPGTYLVKEVATDDAHVVTSTPQQIELRAGQMETATLIFFNQLKPGIHLVKVDSVTMKSLPNVRFEFKLVGGSYKQEFVTDINGEIDLSKLTPGAYEVRELEAPDGYLIDDAVRIVQVNPDENANFVFTNTPKPSFRLIKTSSDGSRLGGVHFRIVRIEDGTHYLDRITDDKGEINISNLEPGVYSVKETATVSDHILDVREYHVELFPGQTSTLTIENQKRPNLVVYKKDADTGEPVPNTTFLVKAADGHSVNEIKTDREGKATLDNLLPGVYEVSEKSVPAPWLMDADPQLVTLYPNRDHEVFFENHKKPVLTINKVDSITGSPIKGAKFQVWYGSNNTSTGELNSLGVFFSDANGQIVIDNLRDGWYKVTELEPAAGFTIKQPATQEFYIKGGESKTVVFENTPLNGIVVEKYDSVTGEALPGCTFQLKYLGGTSGTGGTAIGTKVTGKNGTAIWTGLKPGTYVLEEVDPADGYSIIQSSETIFLADSGEQSVVTVRFTNMPDGSLLIRKVCATNPSVPLQNAEFKVMYADGTLIGDSNGVYRTDEAGEIRIAGLKPGKSVVVTETRAPAGFLLDTQSQVIQIQEGKTVSLTFKNQPKGSLIIQKRDSQTNQPLSGAEFRITTAAGCEVGLDGVIGTSTLTSNGIFTTDSQGEIRISNLAPGAYVISEIKAPDGGYVIDTPSTNVVIGQGGDTQTVVIKNTRKGGLIIEKYDAVTKQPLAGAQFKVMNANGELTPDNEGLTSSNGLYTTDASGQIVLSKLLPGTYVVSEERAPDNYRKDPNPQTVVVNAGDTQTLRFYDDPLCTLTILKRDAVTKKPLKGAEFLVCDSSGHVIGPNNGLYTTGTDGTVTVTGLAPNSTVVVSEKKAPIGYILDETPKNIVVRSGVANSLTFDDEPGTTLIIRKFIEGTENEPLSGVCFKVVDGSGAAIGPDDGVYYTDKAGEIVLGGIEPGTTVIAREIKTVEGYVLDGTPQDIKIEGGQVQQLTFWNKKAGTLVIQKKDSVTGALIAGAQFQLTYANGGYVDNDNGHLSSNGIYTTDDKGEIRIYGITGTVVVKEVKPAPGYVIDQSTQTQTVTVNPLDTQTLVFLNEPLCSLTLTKKDSVTGKPVPGTEFTVKDGNGTVLGRYTTGKDGTVVVTGLVPGSTVVVVETKVPSGYVLNSTPQTIIVKNGANTVSSGGTGTTGGTTNVNPGAVNTGGGTNGGNDLVFENDPKTRLVIEKYITGTTTPLKGVTFLVTESNGQVLGSANGEYTTDENGRIVIEGLEPGVTIIAKEIRTLDGYVLDTTPKTIQIKVGDAQTLRFYNAPIGGLELIKVSESDKSQRIPNTTFEIRRMDGGLVDTVTTDKNGRVHVDLDAGSYYAVEIKAAEGFKIDSTPHYFTIQDGKTTTLTVTNAPFSGIIIHKVNSVTGEGIYDVKFLVYDQNKNPIGEYSTDNEGYIYIDDLTVQGKGKLFIRELEAAPGYELDKEYKTVYVQPGKTIEITWENTPITGQFQIHKFAAEYNEVTGTPAGAPLQGAVYEISEARSGKVVDYITTDARGVAASKPLPLGRYKIVEVTAPAYWQVSGKTFDETLEYSGQIIKVSDYDKPSNLGVTITKRGNAEVLAGSQMRYDFTVANTSNVPLDNYYWHDRIPTDAARATVFTTGTYSARLNYRILYKTNYSGTYQVLASNLLTSSSYSFSLNAIPTQAGEYVTDIYLDFGKVPVGFQSVANPTLTVQVLGTIANGYQIINRADVGGKYQGTWQTGQATWVTIVRKLIPNPTLPKTGY